MSFPGTPLVENFLKSALTRVGAHCPAGMIHRLNSAVNYLELGRWFRERGFEARRRVSTREGVFELAAEEIRHDTVLYLEFGVYEGASMRYWASTLRNPDSHLHGFDSFEGLPEDWNIQTEKGRFSTEGTVPEIDDPRVLFFKGLFEETLPGYSVPEHKRLFVNIDADLYSSARTALGFVAKLLQPGSYLYFDELNDRNHELRALDEFLDETGMSFEVVGASRELAHVLFRRAG